MRAFWRGLTAFCCALVLAACQEDGSAGPVDSGAAPDLVAIVGAECERDGGRWAPTPGKAGFVCYRDLPDAGKFCRAAGDCRGHCLARSRTCSPIEPFFGCHEVLANSGVRQTLCIE